MSKKYNLFFVTFANWTVFHKHNTNTEPHGSGYFHDSKNFIGVYHMLGQDSLCVCKHQQNGLSSQEVKGSTVHMGVCAMHETKCLGAKAYRITGFTLDEYS